MYYHSGTDQYQTTISAGMVTATVSLQDSSRRLADEMKLHTPQQIQSPQIIAKRILRILGLSNRKELREKLTSIDLQNAINRETLSNALFSAAAGTPRIRLRIVDVVFDERILEAVGFEEGQEREELLRQMQAIDLQDPKDLLEKLKNAGVPESLARKIMNDMYAKRILNTLGSSEEQDNEQLLEQLKKIDWQNEVNRKPLLEKLQSAGIPESQAEHIADVWLGEFGSMASHMGLKPVL